MKKPVERLARQRKRERIWREAEQKKAESGPRIPARLGRGTKFYLGVVMALAVLGALIFRASDSATRRKTGNPFLLVMRQVDTLAEALGRYHFHTGVYPDTSHGLAALVRNPGSVPGWNGPYINHLRKDLWGTQYGYDPTPQTNGFPLLFSCGPDKKPRTADDIFPDPARFSPGTDWTNGWVSEERRLPGIRVLNSLPSVPQQRTP